ncbi:hypothetical protein [Streptomyces sp. CC219B]|uniref:hypothetical protein n=1 Tax=Streptomyces sp. CC219B TaxID=3044574 RepID=UPI0024A8C834|nr:hypothetical protein [Streptomyces sp. CC219B]
MLAELCGVEPHVLARFAGLHRGRPKTSTGSQAAVAQARWRAAGAFGCRLCTARRTGLLSIQ